MIRKCGLLFLVTIVIAASLVACGGVALPKTEQLQKDLDGYKIEMGWDTGARTLNEISNIEIQSAQDNLKESKTATLIINASWVENDCDAIVSGKLRVIYDYFDKGGWQVKNVTVENEDALSYKPAAPITDNLIIESLVSKGKFYIVPQDLEEQASPFYFAGKIPDQLLSEIKESNVNLFYWDKNEIADIKVLENVYDENSMQSTYKISVSGESNLLRFNSEYTGVAYFNYPNRPKQEDARTELTRSIGWSFSKVIPTSQIVSIIDIPPAQNAMISISTAGREVATVTYNLNKNADGSYAESTVKIKYLEAYFAGKEINTSQYTVTVSEDKETGGYLLTPKEWVEKPEKNPLKLVVKITTATDRKNYLLCTLYTEDGEEIGGVFTQ